MAKERVERRLATILAADMVGYSRLMEDDEEGIVARQKAHRAELIDNRIVSHGGRIVKTMGDGLLVEFSSPVEAVRCAVEVQRGMVEREAGVPSSRRIQYRIGINLGDVLVEGSDLLGDGVNVAARLEALAEPDGVWVSGGVYEQVNGKIDQSFDDLGHRKVKNIAHSIHVYRVRLSEVSAGLASQPLFDFTSDAIDKTSLITGGCLCEAVRYEISQPPISTGFCHCKICQRSIGASFCAWTAFPTDAVRFTIGEPKYYRSSLIAQRGFCANCGTSLNYMRLLPEVADYIAIFTAGLDNPEDFAPTWHGGIESQLPWIDLHDDLPRKRCEESPELRRAWESAGVTNPSNWSSRS
jgi:class 3 adenylate cyclase